MGNTSSLHYPPVRPSTTIIHQGMRMAQPDGHFPGENASSRPTFNVPMAMRSTTHMHISCANSCLSAAAGNIDFVGVCFYAETGSTVYNDGGRRIRSGYIYVEPTYNLNSSGTLHQQTLDKIFSSNLCKRDGVAVVGFSQQDKELRGRSGTLNDTMVTTLLDDDKEMFFLYRTPIFGALIIYKICWAKGQRIQTICANAASIALILFLIIKKKGNNAVKSRFPDITLEHSQTFYDELFSGIVLKSPLSMDGVAAMLVDICNQVAAGKSLSEGDHQAYLLKIMTPERKFAIKGCNGRFVCGENGNGAIWCNRGKINAWEKFTLEEHGKKVALKSMGKYLCSENGARPMTCNRDHANAWELFDWIDNSDGTFSLRGNNGKFVCSENGQKPMICNRDQKLGWEKFSRVDI